MQRLWLTATKQGLILHPLTFLPYAFATLRAGGHGLAPATTRGLEELRPPYADLLEVDGSEGEVLLFRIFQSTGVVPPAVRRPLDAVLRFERT